MRLFVRVVLSLLALLLLSVVALDLMPARWLSDRIETMASERLGTSVSLDKLSISLLSATPGVVLEGVRIQDPGGEPDALLFSADRVKASIALIPLLTGHLRFNELALIDSQVGWFVDQQGRNNWQPLIDRLSATPDSGQQEEQSSSRSAPAPEDSTEAPPPDTVPAIDSLTLQGITLLVSDNSRGFDAELLLDATGSTTYPAESTTVTLEGQVNGTPVDVEAQLGPLPRLLSENLSIDVDLRASAGDAELTLDGVLALPSQPEEWDMAWTLEAPGLEELAQVTALPLPAAPPFAIAGHLTRDGPEYVIGGLDIQLQNSDLRGDVRLNPSTQPITVFANLAARRIVVDELMTWIPASETDEKNRGKAPSAETGQHQSDVETPSEGERVLSADPIDLAAIGEQIQGAVEFRVSRLESTSWPVDALDIRADIDTSTARLTLNSLGFAGGNVEGNLSLNWQASPAEATLETRLQQIDLRRLLQAADIPDDSYTVLGGRGKFWLSGDSVAAMAASLDGGLFLLMTRGKLDALITELAGIDLYESLVEWVDPDRTRTELRCAYVDLQSADGRVEVAEFVIDTEDTVFRADGTLDLVREQLDLRLEPRPKDTSLLALPTSVNIGGTLAQPLVTPGSELAGRVAASVALAALASPVAALLPLVQADTADDSVFCDGFVGGMNEAR